MKRARKGFTFTGSLVDGPGIDLLELAGLDLTDEEHDRIWNAISPRDLLVEELSEVCEEIELSEFEGGPGQSDTFYEYHCANKTAFVAQLRRVLRALLKA